MRHQETTISSANFGARLSATLIDLFLLSILIFLLKQSFPDFVNLWFFEPVSTTATFGQKNWVFSKSGLIGLWIIYGTIMDCTVMQGTIGKQLMNIVVTDEKGNRISILKSLTRNLCKIVSTAIFGVGFLYMLIDKKSRGWHDLVANTLVVKKGFKTYGKQRNVLKVVPQV